MVPSLQVCFATFFFFFHCEWYIFLLPYRLRAILQGPGWILTPLERIYICFWWLPVSTTYSYSLYIKLTYPLLYFMIRQVTQIWITNSIWVSCIDKLSGDVFYFLHLELRSWQEILSANYYNNCIFYFKFTLLSRIETFKIQCRHLLLDLPPWTTSDFISCQLLTLHLLKMQPKISKGWQNLGAKAKLGIHFTPGSCYFDFSSLDSWISCLFSNALNKLFYILSGIMVVSIGKI